MRVIWYTVEVAAKEGTDGNADFVFIGWFKNSSLFDFDRKVFGALIYYEKSCLPIKAVGSHACCSPNIVVRMIKPFVDAMMDSRGRTRVMIHDAPENEIVEILAGYGIQKDMLPTTMGGSIELNLCEWIANRRAVELEETSIQ